MPSSIENGSAAASSIRERRVDRRRRKNDGIRSGSAKNRSIKKSRAANPIEKEKRRNQWFGGGWGDIVEISSVRAAAKRERNQKS
jgi:hypothetical protein